MADYEADIAKYTKNVNPTAVKNIVNYCGIALRNADGSLVASSDPEEIKRVRDGFAAKKLGLSGEEADAGIAKVVEKLKGVNRKGRVTFYYLLAEVTGTLDKVS